MDPTEFRMRMAEALLMQHRHEVALRHSDLQRRFVLALSFAAAVVLSALRAEFPWWWSLMSGLPLTWAWWEARQIRRLSDEDADRARVLLDGVRRGTASKGSRAQGEDAP